MDDLIRDSVDRRVTLDLDTGKVIEDYRAFKHSIEADQSRLLPPGVHNIKTSFFQTQSEAIVAPPELTWYQFEEQQATRLYELLDDRGREGFLNPLEMELMRELTGPGFEIQVAIFKRVPGRFQAVKIEEVP